MRACVQLASDQFPPFSHLPRPSSLTAGFNPTFPIPPINRPVSHSSPINVQDASFHPPSRTINHNAHIFHFDQRSYPPRSNSNYMSASSMQSHPFVYSSENSFVSASKPAQVSSKITSSVCPHNAMCFVANSCNLQMTLIFPIQVPSSHPRLRSLCAIPTQQSSNILLSGRVVPSVISLHTKRISSLINHALSTYNKSQQANANWSFRNLRFLPTLRLHQCFL